MFKKMIAASLALAFASTASAAYNKNEMYEVTVTNITKGQSFTPVVSAVHKKNMNLFEVGMPASEEIVAMAESGNIAPLQTMLSSSDKVGGTAATEGLLAPGASVTFDLGATKGRRISLAAMMLPTNDTFIALDNVWLPRWGSAVYYANSYDAGSETNDEQCASIPGPHCGGEALSLNDAGEGYIYMSPGTHGEGELSRAEYNWAGAAAKVKITRKW